MMIILLSIGFLLIVALVFGFIGCEEISFGLEINTLNSPFYKIGIFSDRHILTDGSVEDEIIIGLFFINIVVIFYKPVEEENQA